MSAPDMRQNILKIDSDDSPIPAGNIIGFLILIINLNCGTV